MKIAYILDDDISVKTGVVHKIEAKINVWKKLGHETRVFSLRSKSLKPIINNSVIISKFEPKNSLVKKLIQHYKSFEVLDSYLSSFNPDIIYMRYMRYFPNTVNVLKKNAPYIIEINTDDVSELKVGRKSAYLYNQLTRNFLFGEAAGFISFSHELLKNENFSKFDKPAIAIGNGYNFESVSFHKKLFNENVTFVFIGTPGQTWHGVEKVLYLSSKFMEHTFHVIGPSRDELLKMGIDFGSNVHIHGYLDQKRLQKIVSESDIGISSLALHRIGLTEGSPLKSGQYLAHGLPIIYGYKDTDIPDDFEFALNIGNYENNVRDHLTEIDDFIQVVKKMDPQNIRNKAKEFLDYSIKEEARMNFMQKVIQK